MIPARQSPTPRLTDRPALMRNRQRAGRIGFVDVLHRIVADEIEARAEDDPGAPGTSGSTGRRSILRRR